MINVEKDYLQELVLFSLYSKVSDELVFKGGTCLYKFYKLNRFSEDLDFTLRKKINLRKILDRILADLKLLNVKGNIKEIKKYRNEINVRLLLNGPLYRGSKETQCFIPLNISLKEKIIIEPNREMLLSLYREIPNFELFVMQEKEVLSEKIRAVLTREKPRDVYDLWFLLNKRNVKPDFKLVNKKLKLYNFEFNLNHFKKAVNRKKALWGIDLKNLIIGELPNFDKIRAEIFEKFS